MLVPEDPDRTNRPEVSVRNERILTPSEPAASTLTGALAPARKLAVIVPLVKALALTLAWDAPPEHTIVYEPFAATVATFWPELGW